MADRGLEDLLAVLESDMLLAYDRADSDALVRLYKRAAILKEQAGDIDAACFYFTHAYVFALEAGNAESEPLLGKLVQYGRDAYPANR